ncbi:MAG TPA: sulfotransferase domain-containing protein [Candidatus Nanopelagicaceae bacterium]|nr:sulfotransferase domain-containing protein [Candidatus Nanopelagicaceae bacterium]
MANLGRNNMLINDLLRFCKRIFHGVKGLLLTPFYFLKERSEGRASKESTAVKSKLIFVLSFPRSGTHALGSFLSQPEAEFHYHGEFFAFNAWSADIENINKRYPFFSLRFFFNSRRQRKSWRNYRFETSSLDPQKAIRSMLKIPGIHIVKIFPTHLHDATLQKLILEFKPQIIFLRRNHLDRLVSHRKANLSGNWHTVTSDHLTVDISVRELDQYIGRFTEFYRNYLEFSTKSGCEVLDLDFERMLDESQILKIYKFATWAGFDDYSRLISSPKTVKQDSSDVSQQRFLALASEDGDKKEISDFDFARIKISGA